jgi:NADPH2:quinone reductase
MTEQGKLRPQLDERRFALSSVSNAHALLEARQSTGKLVIDVSE